MEFTFRENIFMNWHVLRFAMPTTTLANDLVRAEKDVSCALRLFVCVRVIDWAQLRIKDTEKNGEKTRFFFNLNDSE